MSGGGRRRGVGFYWQVYLLMVISFGLVITFVEGVLEPLTLETLSRTIGVTESWSEAILWIIGVLLPALAVSLMLTLMVKKKLENMARATKRLAEGDLGFRIEETGNDDVFGRLADSFNGMADRVQALLINEKRLLADISHELRSPLTRMAVATELLPRKRNPDDFAAAVAALSLEIDHMGDLVKLLLEQGKARLSTLEYVARMDVSGLISDMIDSYAAVCEERGKTISGEIEPGLAMSAAPVHLRLILDNLLSNAIKYGASRGHVLVRTEAAEDGIELRVLDDGPGVPEQHIENIFRAFFRVDPSRSRASGGTGLGLALVKETVLAMGGTISAANRHPGFEVTVSLPLDNRR